MGELEPTGKPLIDDLRSWAAEYAEQSDGRIKVLNYVPNKYPGQKGVSVQSKTLSDLGTIGVMADYASNHKFGDILEALETHADNHPHVDAIGEALAAGTNVEMYTNHGELIDIAVAQAALYTVLHRRGYEHMQTGIVINKMISFTAYEFFGDYIPSPSVLRMLENEIFLTYPRSNSAKNHLSSADSARVRLGIKGHNIHVKTRIERKLGKGSLLLAMAASGTTDKPLKNNPEVIAMESVGSGTAELMHKPHTLAVPFAAWFQSDEMVLQPVDTPRHIESIRDVHNGMHTIAETLTDLVPDKDFTYLED